MSTVEHAGLVVLVALLFGLLVAVTSSSPADEAAHGLATAVQRKIRCGAVGPGPCWRDPLTVAYGRRLAGAVRALAPRPEPRAGLLPVDFRRCRSAGCATGGAGAKLTGSNMRTTAFTELRPGRPPVVVFWLYRPGQPWQRIGRPLPAATVSRFAKTPLLDSDVPRLVPLETLDGRNHARFPALEEPPWRWQVPSSHAIR